MFVPEMFTHLYHTPCYEQLSEHQRLKYNQLFGLRINEQFIMFEEVFIQGLMPRLKQHQALKNNLQMLAEIESVLRDEEQHSRMFARLNQGLRPDLYARNRNHFTRLSRLEQTLFRMLLVMPGLLPGLLWLLLAMEELTTAISTELIGHPRSDELNEAFNSVHRRHLEDEKRHVAIDMKLIHGIQEHTSVPVRKFNAVLFRKVFGSILRPKRSTIQVIRHLALEEPQLRKLEQTMIDQVTALDPHLAFPGNLVTAEKMPAMYSLFTHYPEYRLPNPSNTLTEK